MNALKIYLLLFFCTNAYATSNNLELGQTKYINELKVQLNNDLKAQYLPFLIDNLGECLDDNCLRKVDTYTQLSLKENENICFPSTDCEFYRCMENKYQCKPKNVPYFEDLAYPTCSNYIERANKKKFSKKGIQWIYHVMVCLQKGLVTECDVNANCNTNSTQKSCNYITEFTLSFHPGCYLNSGPGICNLPIPDQIAIWNTVKPFLTPRERKEAYKVMWHCIANGNGPENYTFD